MCAAESPSPLPLGEVAEQSEDGEGGEARQGPVLPPKGRKALSVTFGDSSPRGRAKGRSPPFHRVLA